VNTQFSNTLKIYRTDKRLTQAQLADLAGITRKSVNAIETGKMVPSVILALRLSMVLNTSVETLFTIQVQ
jgi:putative transcriptional regulator